MIPFLQGFLKNLPAVQSRQLLQLLSQMRDRGEIRTQEEFQQQLNTLSKILSSSDLSQRTPFLTYENGEVLESDAVRTYFQGLQLDLEVMLGEAERASNTIRAHDRFLTENYFAQVESAISELEAKVRAYEVLTLRRYDGFSRVLNSYEFGRASGVPTVTTRDFSFLALLSDLRSQSKIEFLSPYPGEVGLSLPLNATDEIIENFHSIDIINTSDTPQTALALATSDNSPVNAIDSSKDTVWKHSVLLDSHPDSCRLRLNLGFSHPTRVNILSINPLSDLPLKIAEISYIDAGNIEHNLNLGSLSSPAGIGDDLSQSGLLGGIGQIDSSSWTISNQDMLIPIGDIIAKTIKLTLQQDSALDADFFFNSSDVGEWQKNTDMSTFLQNFYRESMGPGSAGDLETHLGILGTSEGLSYARFYEYPFGFKSIQALRRNYKNAGVIALEPISIRATNSIALFDVVENTVSEDTSIEYFLRKENYSGDGTLLDVESFPVLPYGATSLSERLVLTDNVVKKSLYDTGQTRFFPDFDEDFKVYLSDTELVVGIDYYLSLDNGLTWESTVPPTEDPSTPKKCLIRISSPNSSNIYRVEYTALLSGTSDGSEVYINEAKTVWLERFNIYNFKNARPVSSVARSKIGLQILIRSNTLNTRVSPFIKEIVLLGD